MPRPISIAVIAIFCFAFTARAEDKPSPAVKRILDNAVAGVRKNRTEFDKANKKPLDDAKSELQELAKKLVDDGKAQEATSVLKQVGTLEADVMRMANAPDATGGASPSKPLKEKLAGKWTHPNYKYLMCFASDGSFQQQQKDGKTVARGQLRLIEGDMADVTLDNGYRLRVMPAGSDCIAMLAWDPNGRPDHSWVFERIK